MGSRDNDVAAKRVKKLERDLGKAGRTVVREASAKMLTELAERTRNEARRNIEKTFTLRTKGSKRWILGGVKSTFTTARRPLHRQFTIAGAKNRRGSKRNFMGIQETGGQLPNTKGNARRITTAQGSREGDVARPRQKIARGKFKPGKMKLERPIRTKGMSRVQRQIATVRRARRRGKRLIWMRLAGENKTGIFHLRGSVKKPEIKMVHRIYKKKLRVKPKPWFEPAKRVVLRDAEATGKKHLKAAFKRHRILK